MTVHPLDPDSGEPPFEQLRTQIARRVAEGELEPGTKLPTVRGLAAELGIATNTVARAYTELESDGVVVGEGRRGTFVAAPLAPADAVEAAAEYAATARRLGLSLTQATRVLEQGWSA